MSLWERLFRRKSSGTQPPPWMRASGSVALWPYPERERTQPHQSLVLTAAVRRVADLYREARMIVVRNDEPVNDHPVLRLIDVPNPYYDGDQLADLIVWSLVTDGNCYILYDRDNASLWWLDHRRIEPRSDDPRVPLQWYEYTAQDGTHRLAREDVVHIRRGCNPDNPVKGWSPVQTVVDDLTLESACSEFCMNVVANMGVPSVAISPKQGETILPTPEQNRELKLRWQSETSGRNRGNVVVLPFPVDIERLMLSPDDLSVSSLVGQTVSRICASVGVDPMVIGLPSDTKTYSNYEQALESVVRQVVIPLQETVADQLTNQLLALRMHDMESRVAWDRSEVYVLQDDENAKRESVTRLYQSGVVTLNEARAMLGLSPVRGGDVVMSRPMAGLL